MKKIFCWFKPDYFLATLFLFVTISLLGLITFNLSFFNPMKKALTDFNFSDLLYSSLNTQKEALDTNVILVNIGHLNRRQIARQISNIRKSKPKVIGFDGFFSARRDPVTDSILRAQLYDREDLVMACFLTGKDELTGKFDSLETSDPFFRSRLKGFVNLGGADPKSSTVRYFSPAEIFQHDTLHALAIMAAGRYHPIAVGTLLERKNDREIINYVGNRNAFICFDADEVLDSATDLSILKDKIVLMGYMGESFRSPPDLEDIYYTPMNPVLAGRSTPDMYGVIIHANIIHMILAGSYINKMPAWLTLLLSFVICYFYIWFITWFKAARPMTFKAVFPVFLLLLNVLIVYIFFLLYKYSNYSIDSGYFLVPILLFETFLTYYERILLLINRYFPISRIFLTKK